MLWELMFWRFAPDFSNNTKARMASSKSLNVNVNSRYRYISRFFNKSNNFWGKPSKHFLILCILSVRIISHSIQCYLLQCKHLYAKYACIVRIFTRSERIFLLLNILIRVLQAVGFFCENWAFCLSFAVST